MCLCIYDHISIYIGGGYNLIVENQEYYNHQEMKDFNSVLSENPQKIAKNPHQGLAGMKIKQRTKWDDAKDYIIKISGPIVLTIFTGPFNTSSIILQVTQKPLSDSFTRKIESSGQGARLVRTGIFGDNKIYQPFQFKGYNDCLTQLGKQGIRGLYKGNLTGMIMGLINTKIRTELYDQGNKITNFSDQWKSNILTILTCTVADLFTQPFLFCQTRLALQNSLSNFRTYGSAFDVLRKNSPKKWMAGSSVLLFKNIIFSYSWISFFQNAPLQSFIISTVLSHILTYPFMTIIRQQQSNGQGIPMMNQRSQKIRQTLKRIWSQGGIRGFYRGFGGYAVVHTFLSFIMIDMNARSGYFKEMAA